MNQTAENEDAMSLTAKDARVVYNYLLDADFFDCEYPEGMRLMRKFETFLGVENEDEE
jgi:hypothetical protein